MTLEQILSEIHKGEYEIEAYEYLSRCLVRRVQLKDREALTLSAQLKAIQRINKNRNQAIDALCERE